MNTETSTSHYLRVEGMNLAHFVLDTADLSTMRGGGLLLLEGVDQAVKALGEACPGRALVEITSGASSGVYAFVAGDDEEARAVRDRVAKALGEEPRLRHATFVVDVTRKTGEFRADLERVLAANRHRQMTTPTLVAPFWNRDPGVGPCAIGGLRPATEAGAHLPDGVRASVDPGVAVRRAFGREQRQDFYRRWLGSEYDFPTTAGSTDWGTDWFTDTFEQLTGPPYAPECPELMRDKLAVLYVDGNKFGSLQRSECRSEEAQRAFDHAVKARRRSLLAALMMRMDARPKGWFTGSATEATGQRRLETLLWGGDEIVWVVPAWKGWELAELFFEVSASWGAELNGREHPLTHAAGLVFAHRKAPIHELKRLAMDLADGVKGQLDREEISAQDRRANRLDYEILEGFDQVGGDVEAYRARRVPGWMRPGAGTGSGTNVGRLGELALRGDALGRIRAALVGLLEAGLPTRQIHAGYDAWWKSTQAVSESAGLVSKENLNERQREALERLAGATSEATLWYHLARLWDYVAWLPKATP